MPASALRVRAASPRGAPASFVTGAPRVADGGARIVDVSTLAFEYARRTWMRAARSVGAG
ncbi:hypothetical protein WI93_07260 [Burkholderia vietnamiensis]|nr:hypothetical protein WI93_07260 [Burkholderia vietnamiensis]